MSYLRPRTTLVMLETFEAVIRLGSIGAAARNLGLSQPTISATLARLERSLGRELVTRTPSGVTATATGLALIAAARATLTASDDFESVADQVLSSSNHSPAPLHIAASLTVAEYLLPEWLSTLPKLHPQLTVCNSMRVQELVLTGQVDLGFTESPQLRSGLSVIPVGHDELVPVVRRGHALSKAIRPAIPLSELLSYGLLVREDGSGTRKVLQDALRAARCQLPADTIELGSTAAIKTALQLGDRWTALSRFALAKEIAQGELVALTVPELSLRRQLLLISATGRRLRPTARQLISHLSGEATT